MLQEEDDRRIERLKRRTWARSKVDVVRAGLDLLERETEREARVRRWRRASATAAASSREINAAFRRHSRLARRVPEG